MPISAAHPVLHPGALHPGPALTLALRGPKDKLGKGAKRTRWDERHHVTWKNDYQNTNMRSYFDRFVDRVDIPVCPRPRLRPTWVVDVPEGQEEAMPRIFDPVNATFKDQPKWDLNREETVQAALRLLSASKPKKAQKNLSSMFDAEEPPAASASPSPTRRGARRPRTPRTHGDLKAQRTREAEWDGRHGVVYSRFNERFQQNVRSYFDRWKDDEGGKHERDPTWRLPPDKRSPLDRRARSEPLIRAPVGPNLVPGRPAWDGSF